MSVTVDGVTVARGSDLLEAYRNSVEATISDEGRDWQEPGDLHGVLAAAIAGELGQVLDVVQWSHDAADLRNACGSRLDALLEFLAEAPRTQATQSTVALDLGGTTGTLVPAGRVVQDADGERWVLDDPVLLPGSGTATANRAGPVEAPSGTLTVIRTPWPGWSSVTNPTDAEPGEPLESNDAARLRGSSIKRGPDRNSAQLYEDLVARDDVDDASIVENPTSSPVVVDGVIVLAWGVLVTVLPSTSAEVEAFVRAFVAVDGPVVEVQSASTVNVDLTITVVGSVTVAEVSDVVDQFFDALVLDEDVVDREVACLIRDDLQTGLVTVVVAPHTVGPTEVAVRGPGTTITIV